MPHVIAVGNRKGGVGKTSYVLNLAHSLQLLGIKVLCGDLDPQRNLTDVLIGDAEPELTLFDALYGEQAGTLGQIAISTNFTGIDLLPGDESLARIEVEQLMAPEARLKNAASGAALDHYDVILLDMPPALGRLTLNGLIYANEARIVIDCESFSVKGAVKFMELTTRVRGSDMYNPGLAEPRIVVNRFAGSAENKYQLQALQEAYGSAVIAPSIPRATAVADGQSGRVPLSKLPAKASARASEAFSSHAHAIKKELKK